ncbi:MAG: beta-galactosidase, partial [Ignavibacteriaceae bacterium]
MQKLLSENYFPFGSQYYRAPSPHKGDWETDLKNMAASGFNTVKFWIQWRWNNPAEGVYYFDDIDKLMDLAKKYKLKVMLNTIFDVAPAWIYEKYPDASMITLGGKVIGPQTQPHRQIGGLGYCFNHDGVIEHFFEFLKASVERYKDHPALEIWNVGSEPELTSSMAEMRAYADDAEKINDMLCYCDNCKRKFRGWLKSKYKSLDKLNESWNRNYTSFDQAELPKTRNTFNDIIDWRMFFVYTIGENVKRRFETARDVDRGKHPLMCHHVFIQGFPVTSTASDPWNVGQYGDLHGFTQMDDAMMIDILRSCAKDKPVISAEMLMLMGYTLDMPKYIDENDVKRLIFRGVAGNLKGFIFWQYRPEILGREAPTWGLTYLDGTETPWLKSFSKVGKILQKNSRFLMKAKPSKAEVAILYNPENQVFAWASTGNEKTATNSLTGYHSALYNYSYPIDFIHPVEIEKGILDKYKVLVVPFPYVLSKKICTALEKWVKAGGTLIGESYFAGWNIEHGHHEKIVPGYGLHRIFKARQGVVEPANKGVVTRIGITKDTQYKRKNEKITGAAATEYLTSKNIFSDEAGVRIIIKKDLNYIHSGDEIRGTIVKETLIPEGAEVIAEFDTGEAAVTVSNYGKGKAVLIGSYIGLPVIGSGNEANEDLIASLIEYTSEIDKPSSAGTGKVRTDVLTAGKEVMIIIQNMTSRYVESSVVIPVKNIQLLKEQFDGSELKVTASK